MKTTDNQDSSRNLTSGDKNELVFSISPLHQFWEENADYIIPCGSNNYFEIIWITKGSGSLFLDMQAFRLASNKLVFVKPGQVRQCNFSEQPSGYIFSFSESFLSTEHHESNSTYHTSLFKMFASAAVIDMNNDDLPDMKNIAAQMMKEFYHDNLFRVEILRRYFKIWLIYITRQLQHEVTFVKPSRNMEIVQQFMDLLEKNYKSLKMVSDYASRLSVTPNYLNEIIKKTTGFSAGHHIRQRIVLEAKRQATYSGRCMKEIAYFLGFYDMAHFSKLFKNTTGMNFSDYKRGNLLPVASSSLSF
jgi:YesN/AraC family two-component response regulator